MLKGIQQKLVLIFVLIIIAIMSVLGTFLINNINVYYHTEFRNRVSSTFTGAFIEQLKSAGINENPVSEMEVMLNAYSANLGIDYSYRNYYILDAKTGSFLSGTDTEKGKSLIKTPAISEAMVGKVSIQTEAANSIMEYAVPIGEKEGNPQYIVYIADSKDAMNDVITNMISMVLQSLLLGVMIAILLGIFLSRTISKPIISLTRRAEKLAKGEFDIVPTVKEKDEIGILSNTFKYMSDALAASVNDLGFEKNKLETVMQYMSDGIIAFDSNGQSIVINPAAKKLLNIEDEKEINFDEYFTKFFDDLYIGDFIYLDSHKIEQRVIQVGDLSLRLEVSPFKFQNDKNRGVMVVIQDITKQESVENSRREFVANVSHELKTPITTIKTYIETIRENDLDKETENNFLDVVDREADRMTRLIGDLLTLSKLDSKIILANREYINVSKLIEDVIVKMSIEAKKHGHELTYHEMNELPPLFMDKDRLEQILINIISNSIKYTPKDGFIDVFVRAIYGNIYIKIKDTGIGIPKKDLERIFERFYRVDKARSREQGGTGLGLAISKEMINAFGGDIYIESEENKGCEVCIVLPVDGKRTDTTVDDKEMFKDMSK
ncbi:MAG: cell wall metabolism sensor histidine kinase WalK [Ruminococcaceae bacterium]|nr:cell wall metabolism sensor histidine kinase WalK [Oscillospiraceae bacterium]